MSSNSAFILRFGTISLRLLQSELNTFLHNEFPALADFESKSTPDLNRLIIKSDRKRLISYLLDQLNCSVQPDQLPLLDTSIPQLDSISKDEFSRLENDPENPTSKAPDTTTFAQSIWTDSFLPTSHSAYTQSMGAIHRLPDPSKMTVAEIATELSSVYNLGYNFKTQKHAAAYLRDLRTGSISPRYPHSLGITSTAQQHSTVSNVIRQHPGTIHSMNPVNPTELSFNSLSAQIGVSTSAGFDHFSSSNYEENNARQHAHTTFSSNYARPISHHWAGGTFPTQSTSHSIPLPSLAPFNPHVPQTHPMTSQAPPHIFLTPPEFSAPKENPYMHLDGNTSFVRMPKVQIPPFDKKDPMTWLKKYELLTAHWSLSYKARFLPTYLTAAGEEWPINHAAAFASSDWDNICELFKFYYKAHKDHFAEAAEFHKAIQTDTESGLIYVERKLALAQKLRHPPPEIAIVENIISGLLPPLRTTVYYKSPQAITALRLAVKKAQDALPILHPSSNSTANVNALQMSSSPEIL